MSTNEENPTEVDTKIDRRMEPVRLWSPKASKRDSCVQAWQENPSAPTLLTRGSYASSLQI